MKQPTRYEQLFTEDGQQNMPLTLKELYSSMDNKRSGVDSRNEEYAAWTTPAMYSNVNEDVDSEEEVQLDYQSLGNQLVNGLANKMVQSLFNPAKPFFRIDLTDEERKQLMVDYAEESELDKNLSKVERKSMKNFAKTNSMYEYIKAAKLAVITGECLIHRDANNNKSVYSQKNYVVARSRVGTETLVIIKEEKTVVTLPQRLYNICKQHLEEEIKPDTAVSIYTCIEQVGEEYYVWQEIEDFDIAHNQAGKYTKDTLPYFFWKWEWMRGRTYCIGLVELNGGDFNALSRLANAIDDYTAIATDLKILVNPQGNTDINAINEKPAGSACAGVEADIHILKYEVAQVAEFLKWRFEELKKRLGAQFLNSTVTTRDAERVTAEEIRRDAIELDSGHGGIWSRWSVEVQRPEARALLAQVSKDLHDVDVTILTGMQSLARASELDNMRAYLNDLALISNIPEDVKIRMKLKGVMNILAQGHGVDDDKFMRSEEEVKQEQERILQMNAAGSGMEANAVQKGSMAAQKGV